MGNNYVESFEPFGVLSVDAVLNVVVLVVVVVLGRVLVHRDVRFRRQIQTDGTLVFAFAESISGSFKE